MDEIISLYAAEPADTPARRRIRRLSLPFEIAFAGLALLAATFIALIAGLVLWPGADAIWLGADATWVVLGGDHPPAGTTSFLALPLATQITGGALFALMFGALAFAFNALRALFRTYRRGEIFGAAPERLMHRAGAALIIYALVPGLFQPLLRALGSPDRAWFHGDSLAALLIGGALFVFARVMALGHEAEREARGFI